MGDITLLAVSLPLGVVIGILSGLLGIGGGTVMVPAFRLILGMDPVSATATSLFSIVPTSISGAISRVREKTCIPVLGVVTGLGGAFTSPVGVWLAQISPSWTIMVAAAVIIGWSAISMISKAVKTPKDLSSKNSCENQSGLAAQEVLQLSGRRRALLVGLIIGLIAGVASGYVGVGGGFIMVPLMVSLLGVSMRLASGSSLIAVMILAVPGTVEQALLGNITYLIGISVALGSIPGAVVGARLAGRAPERLLRLVFGVFLLLAVGMLVTGETGILAL